VIARRGEIAGVGASFNSGAIDAEEIAAAITNIAIAILFISFLSLSTLSFVLATVRRATDQIF
jgi:hypothetical protein